MFRNLSKVFKQQLFLQKKFCNTSSKANAYPAKHNAYDALQKQAMKEQCILVNMNDEPTGFATKEDCHRVNLNNQLKLHRAFSVILFNSNDEMLVQRRSNAKITFPDTYTNSCCSHPLYDIEDERVMPDELGVRKAAQRRLNQELGIRTEQIHLDNFQYMTRILYTHPGDGVWGESEISYIMVLQKDFELKPNMNEVSELRYIKRENFEKEVKQFKVPMTPWFQLMFEHKLLYLWWDNLHQLDKVKNHNIQRFN